LSARAHFLWSKQNYLDFRTILLGRRLSLGGAEYFLDISTNFLETHYILWSYEQIFGQTYFIWFRIFSGHAQIFLDANKSIWTSERFLRADALFFRTCRKYSGFEHNFGRRKKFCGNVNFYGPQSFLDNATRILVRRASVGNAEYFLVARLSTKLCGCAVHFLIFPKNCAHVHKILYISEKNRSRV
jgi:hypothetical protein